MNEIYLHFLWRRKRLPISKLRLTNGKALLIHDVGTYNEQLAGPDFQFGSVSINGVRMFGHIEIHVKSSDWRKHGHQNDPAYLPVILHVVHEDDEPLHINGELVPTLELKALIDLDHFTRYQQRTWKHEEFPCRNELPKLTAPYFESMKAKALYQRLTERSSILKEIKVIGSVNLFYQCLGVAFGMGINKPGFERLTRRVPLYALKGLSARRRYQLLLVESGVWQFSDAVSTQTPLWHYKGTRPANFPDVRLRQFAHLASRYDFDTSFVHYDALGMVNYFRAVLNELWTHDTESIPRLSLSFQNHLLINGLVPFLWFTAQMYEDEDLAEKALELLKILPAESNGFVRKWQKAGIQPTNAYDTQAMLALYRDYCSRKKCLSCEVGNKVLNRIK